MYQGDIRHEHSGDDAPRGCGICAVEIAGEEELKPACATPAAQGMKVTTQSDRIGKHRQDKLASILASHPHACLTCAQNEGCTRTQCSSNVPENERCCPQLGHCELQDVAEYVGIPGSTRRWQPTDLPVLEGPLFIRDYNLCIGCTRCVRACADLRGVEAIGFVRGPDGRNIIGTVAPTLEESGCKFCTACVEVCPTGALTDRNIRPGKKEADLVPCRAACPAGVDIPWYLRLIRDGRFDEAHSVIREKVPLPGVLGRICIRPCEDACRRGEVNEPIAICALKRAAADRQTGGWKKTSARKPPTGQKAAVVGSGPAGLSCAFYLAGAGHGVTIFEAEAEPGGMLRYGLPEYRLPQAVLDREIQEVLSAGIKLQTGRYYGRDFTAASLKEEGYRAVFLGLGAQKARRIPLPGADKQGVIWGLDFLRDARKGMAPSLTGRVVVIGGGNVAIDAALTARRLGASRVYLCCLEARDEMPAHEWECQDALTEGVAFHNSRGPLEVLGDEKVQSIRLVRCTSVFDAKGAFAPRFDESQTSELPADWVILAVGQAARLEDLAAEPTIKTSGGLIVVGDDQAASMPGVWAGGDIASMPGSAVAAVAAGRRAAAAMDKALGGSGDIEEVLFDRPGPDPLLGRDLSFAARTRETVPCRLPEARSGFEEVETGFDNDQARAEAARCLQCDLRPAMSPAPWPPEAVQAVTPENIAAAPESEGIFILYDGDKKIIAIKGDMNIRRALREAVESNDAACFFEWEEDKMYSRRESELLQQYLQEHGEMPGGGADELDDPVLICEYRSAGPGPAGIGLVSWLQPGNGSTDIPDSIHSGFVFLRAPCTGGVASPLARIASNIREPVPSRTKGMRQRAHPFGIPAR